MDGKGLKELQSFKGRICYSASSIPYRGDESSLLKEDTYFDLTNCQVKADSGPGSCERCNVPSVWVSIKSSEPWKNRMSQGPFW